MATIRLPMSAAQSAKLPKTEVFISPDYWAEACAQLMEKDLVLRRLIPLYGQDCMQSRGDAFSTLARSVVGQQISVKAADSVWAKFCAEIPKITPQKVREKSTETLRSCGLSARKVDYIFDLAAAFIENRLAQKNWQNMSDQEIIDKLTTVRGIGVWSAQMFLMFYENRPNILPIDDIGLQKAVAKLYLNGARPDKKTLQNIALKWQPWQTVATWYLWRSLDPLVVAY